MEKIYVFHLEYYSQSPSSGFEMREMAWNQHAPCTEKVIDVLASNYDSALYKAKQEYLKQNPCSVFGSTRPIRVISWDFA